MFVQPNHHLNIQTTTILFTMLAPLQFKKLTPDAIVPAKATQYSAGFDLCANEEVTIVGGEGVKLVKTGIAVRLPPDHYGRIALRSGHCYKQHMAVTAGVIDRDYVGNVGVLVYITKVGHSYTIQKGERFAQLLVERLYEGPVASVEEFAEDLGTHLGYGSTGHFSPTF